MEEGNVLLTDMDRWRLARLLNRKEMAALGDKRARFRLETKLDEARTVPPRRVPRTLVTMNSRIRLVDLETGEALVRVLVYPDDADVVARGVCVFHPLGQKLLGCRAGDVIEVEEQGHPRRFRIDAVVYQPEADGLLYL